MDDRYDLLIIGAGPSGLCAARTFLECEPDIRIVLIDSNEDVGGVWATKNVYPGLKTNNVFGMVDFSDFPMDKSFGIKPGEHVTGEVMHDYLVAYAQKWDILRRIKFNTVVLTVERDAAGTGWKVTVKKANEEEDSTNESILHTKKLIVATGLTNEPHRPRIPGSQEFGASILHSADLGREKAWLDDPSVKTVAVLGGGKSAYDATYLAVSAGKEVEWVIRKSGKGPAWVFPPQATLGPFKALREKLILRRLISCFSPFFWGSNDGLEWIRYFLHATKIGKSITQAFWTDIQNVTLEDCGYQREICLNVLEPEQSPFWYGTASGTWSYSTDFFAAIKSGRVRIHREDISHLSPHTVHLTTDPKPTTLPVSLLITATGFTVRPTFQFLPASLSAELGLPVLVTSLTPQQTELWTRLESQADAKISKRFPRLISGPFTSPSSITQQPYNPGAGTPTSDLNMTPYRLYRAIVPPSLALQGDRTIAFIGYVSNIANTIRLEIQSLWAYAYLTHSPVTNPTLPIDPTTILSETALLSRFARHRSPYGHGRWFPDLNFDQLPFIDMLMRDLGLPVNRKRYWWGCWWSPVRWLRELIEPYGQEEYRDVVGEWLAVQARRRRSMEGSTGWWEWMSRV